MKKLLFFLAILLMSIQTYAQFILEHTYDSTGYFQRQNREQDYGLQLFYLVNLEIDGDKYVQINKPAQTIKFYNLNHTLWKSISYSNVSTNIGPAPSNDKDFCSILYITQSLFNTDAKIEFMYTFSEYFSIGDSGVYRAITQIVNEDDSILFTDTAAAPLVMPTWPNQYYPIYNTTDGTKMILSNVTGKAEVYSLRGTLTDNIAETNKKLLASLSNPYPNPNNGSAKIDYTLPPGVNEGEIVFYNLQGNEVKRFKVDKTFNTLLISTKDIAAGTYYYQLQTAGESSGGKKMVVIK